MKSNLKALRRMVLLGGVLLATGAQAALVNGSFEQGLSGLLAGGGYCYPSNGSCQAPVAGWQGQNFALINAQSSAWGNPSAATGWNSSFGSVVLGLQQAYDTVSYAEQWLNLASGRYKLSWFDSGRAGTGDVSGPTSYQVFYAGDQLSATAFDTTPGQDWTEHMLTFDVTGSGTLRFAGLPGSENDATAFIDNIRLTYADGREIGTVPEPASAALLGLGLLGVAATRRRAAQRG